MGLLRDDWQDYRRRRNKSFLL